MSKDSGYLVETKTGKQGRTYHRERLLNGKVIVHLETEEENNQNIKYLCDPQTVKIIGYVD
jgi:hypothetical protein